MPRECTGEVHGFARPRRLYRWIAFDIESATTHGNRYPWCRRCTTIYRRVQRLLVPVVSAYTHPFSSPCNVGGVYCTLFCPPQSREDNLVGVEKLLRGRHASEEGEADHLTVNMIPLTYRFAHFIVEL